MRDQFDDAPNIAVFADFENVAIGARDANYNEFDIHLILERLLDKGNIVVKRSYADWDSFKSAKRQMHEAAFEMIEVPHVSYSGKNSADIRMVVDALDLSYTKKHVQIFCIITGDSDFSPLVSKLRENNKLVIGVGVKNAASRLLVENCDEYIFYDDLVRSKRSNKRGGGRRKNNSRSNAKSSTAKTPPKDAKDANAADETGTKDEALEMILDTAESLFRERDENIYGSLIKQVLKRKKPQFNETFYGYRSFNDLIEDATERGLLETAKDEKSGGYIVFGFGPKA